MDLYQELILEHYKRPVRAGLREPFEAEVHHVNPTCGDEVTLRVHVAGQRRRRRRRGRVLRRHGLLDQRRLGVDPRRGDHRRVRHARPRDVEAMRSMLTSKGEDPGDEEKIGDGVALAGVAKYPARIKCALLSWMAFTDALHQAEGAQP